MKSINYSLWEPFAVLFSIVFLLPWSIPYISGTRPPILRDSAFFEYVGWHITQNGLPYVTILDLKTPLTLHVSSTIWIVTGGDPLWAHRLSVGLMVAVQVALALLVGVLVYDAIESNVGALTSSIGFFALQASYTTAAQGLRPKTFMIFIGLLAIYEADHNRYLTAGGLAVLSGGFFQVGFSFLIVVMGMAMRRARSKQQFRVLPRLGTGVAVGMTVTLLPYLLHDALGNVLLNTIYYHFVITGSITIIERIIMIERIAQGGLVFLPIGTLGVLISIYHSDLRRWLPAIFLLTAAQPWYLDLNGGIDMLAWWTITIIGAGIAVGKLDQRLPTSRGRTVYIIAVTITVILLVTSSLPEFTRLNQRQENLDSKTDFERYIISDLYWNQNHPDSCIVVAQRQYFLIRGNLGIDICQQISIGEFFRLLPDLVEQSSKIRKEF